MIDNDDLYQFAKMDLFPTFRVWKKSNGTWKVSVIRDDNYIEHAESENSLAEAIILLNKKIEDAERVEAEQEIRDSANR